MSSNPNLSIETDGVVNSVKNVQMEKVVQSGSAENYAVIKGKEARRKARERFERKNTVQSSNTAPRKESRRRMQNRMYKSTSTAAKQAIDDTFEEVHNAASVQEHSLQMVSKHLGEQREQAEKDLSEIRKHNQKRKYGTHFVSIAQPRTI